MTGTATTAMAPQVAKTAITFCIPGIISHSEMKRLLYFLRLVPIFQVGLWS